MASLFASKKLIVYCVETQELTQEQKIILLNLIVDYEINFLLTEKTIAGYELITEVHKDVNHLIFKTERSPVINIKNKLRFNKEFKEDFSKNLLILCSPKTMTSCKIELRNNDIVNKSGKNKIFLFYKNQKNFFAEEIKLPNQDNLQPVNGFLEIAESVPGQ